MKVLDLFSGIGGISLGLERAGMETIAFCEQNKHAQEILKKHWPNVPIYEDVCEVDGEQFRGSVDVVCGGFPCQDLSQAGKQAGFSGERSSLYREMLRIIGECRPRFAIFENVTGLLTGDNGRWFAQFLYDLAEIGFDAEWHCISASYLGASHHRDRIWIIAYPSSNDGYASKNEERGEQRKKQTFFDASKSSKNASNTKGRNDRNCEQKQTKRQKQELGKSTSRAQVSSNANAERCEGFAKIANNIKRQVELMRSSEAFRRRFDLSEPPLCGANDGVSRRLDRLRRLGNSVVPQIPEAIGLAIMNLEGE